VGEGAFVGRAGGGAGVVGFVTTGVLVGGSGVGVAVGQGGGVSVGVRVATGVQVGIRVSVGWGVGVKVGVQVGG